jgi:flagellar protein FlaG
METQEDSMTDAMNAIGSQSPSPPVAALASAQVVSAQGSTKGTSETSTTVAKAEVKEIQKAAEVSQASKLDMSPASGVSNKPQASPIMTMEQAAQAFQDYLKSLPSNLQFQPDYQAGIVVFKIVNPVTQKVIRQLPPEEVVQQAKNLRMAEQQTHSGILLDKSL